MNISGFTNIQPYLPVVSSPSGVRADEVEEVPSSEPILSSPASGAEEKPFYEYEDEPWLTDPAIDFAVSREEYLNYKGMIMEVELALLKHSYSVALVDLADAYPEIAAKKFSITMGEDGGIKIIDSNNELSDEDIDTLTDFLNGAGHLKSRVQMVVKHILMFADHDHDTLGGRYNVGLENIQHVLDVGQVLNESAGMMQDEWIRQIKANAEKQNVSYFSVSV